MSIHKILVAALAVCVLGGCDDDGPDPDVDAGDEQTAPTYYADVLPLVQRECLSCHVEGGIAPFALDTYELVSETAVSVVGAIEAGYMPPWLPDDQCREYEHARGLSAEERDVFALWLAADMPEGDPADAPPPPEGPPVFEETDVARMAEPYTPDASRPDDYRCFVLDQDFTEDSFITGSEVVPGAAALVHHVLVYAVRADQVPTIEAADTMDDGPGYTCFGGPFVQEGSDETGNLGLINLGAWVPGMVPRVARDGRGIYVPAGSRIVMQVHYNLLAGDPEPDSTEFHVAVTTDPPEFHTTTFPTAILDLDIGAGEPSARHRATFRSYRSDPLRLIGVTPHMHLLGTSIGMNMVPPTAETGDNDCLIQVPEWDFNWQQGYRFMADDEVMLQPGAGLELQCIYDNSETNQPVINGERLAPRDVEWGEGTLDEMCLLYVQYEEPWTGPPQQGCDALPDCLAGCSDGDTQCLLSCEGLGGACRVCALEGTLGCAQSECLTSLAPAAGCIQECILSYAMLGGSFDRCMATECPDTWPAARDCVSGVVDAGTCTAQLNGCGVTF